MELDGKTALVSGVGSMGGIGFHIAHVLRERGASVVLSGRDPDRGARAAQALGDGTRFVAADLADLADVRRLASEAGEPDILVHNAGVMLARPTIDQDADSYGQALDANLRAPYFLTAALAPAMLAKGSGSIVNISSMAARSGLPAMSVYGASKAGLEALTRIWAAEFAGRGVRVNTVMPGPTRTEGLIGLFGEQAVEQMAGFTMLKRMADPAEIAEVVAFLAGPRSSFITGALIPADGGATAG
jgi:NAD(P)-dependent dehydrogenase (short-subunit alcohol dehydrogenase family)